MHAAQQLKTFWVGIANCSATTSSSMRVSSKSTREICLANRNAAWRSACEPGSGLGRHQLAQRLYPIIPHPVKNSDKSVTELGCAGLPVIWNIHRDSADPVVRGIDSNCLTAADPLFLGPALLSLDPTKTYCSVWVIVIGGAVSFGEVLQDWVYV